MKFFTASLLLSGAALVQVQGFRDQTTKKQKKNQQHARGLETEPVCTVNHDIAQSATELNVFVQAFPGDKDGLFDITISDPPYAPEGSHVTVPGWCIDYDRPIDTGYYDMDVFSAFDSDLHSDAVNFRQYLPNIAWLINNVNVGDTWPATNDCVGGAVRWGDIQGALWKIVDDNDGSGSWYAQQRTECIAVGIAEMAKAEGNDYEIDCTDPNEQIPLVFVVDNDETGEILNQVIMSETMVSSVEGLCNCEEGATRSVAFLAPPKETAAPTAAPTDAIILTTAAVPETDSPTASPTASPTTPAKVEDRTVAIPEDDKKVASGSGDPHFKTWSGHKFDYHGECDLVLVNNPSFANGLGMRLHIRTTRVKYFSYIEQIALQIGEDVLEFNNDVQNFLINGAKVEAQRKYHETKFAGFVVRRDKKAISIRLDPSAKAKIDFVSRSNGFPAVVLDGGNTDMFKGSLGLLGEWSTGNQVARDGAATLEDATEFALEWQVRDTEPLLFQTARFPQFPTQCTPPKKMMGGRLGMSRMKKAAEKACAHWNKEDKEDCIFDVIATRSVLTAEEGDLQNVE